MYPGEHEPIVESAVFERVQVLLHRNSRSGGVMVGNRHGALLKGLFICGACGRRGHTRVTQPRITQVLNLLHLAPDIQEELLFLPLVAQGRDPINEKQLRRVCAETDWRKQRQLWVQLKFRIYP